MTLTTPETLSVNGVILNTLAYNIESLTGRLKVPKFRTGNLEVAGRHGSIRSRQKKYEQNQLILPMWVRGCDVDGYVPSSGSKRIEFFKNLDTLTRTFSSFGTAGLLDIRHTLPDGTVRQCFGEVVESIDFSTQGRNPLGKFSVALDIPDPFWQDVTGVAPVVSTPTSPTLGTLTTLAGGTAPIEDATFTLTGPMTNPKVEAYYNNAPLPVPVWFQYLGAIGAGQSLTVNCSAFTLVGSGFTANYNIFSHSGSARWMSLIPGPAAAGPQINLVASALTGASSITVSAKRKYLVG